MRTDIPLLEERRFGVKGLRATEAKYLKQRKGLSLLYSYRSIEAWSEMIELVPRLPTVQRDHIEVREQLGMALNRAGRTVEAEQVLQAATGVDGARSNTLGILGRVYKDRWLKRSAHADWNEQRKALALALNTYKAGWEMNHSDNYPGINLLTLMQIDGETTLEASEIRAAVEQSVQERIEDHEEDYFDYATLLELAVLDNDESAAFTALAPAMKRTREVWEPKTTAQNIRLIRLSHRDKGKENRWIAKLESALLPPDRGRVSGTSASMG